jgi:hypothetical protein
MQLQIKLASAIIPVLLEAAGGLQHDESANVYCNFMFKVVS